MERKQDDFKMTCQHFEIIILFQLLFYKAVELNIVGLNFRILFVSLQQIKVPDSLHSHMLSSLRNQQSGNILVEGECGKTEIKISKENMG